MTPLNQLYQNVSSGLCGSHPQTICHGYLAGNRNDQEPTVQLLILRCNLDTNLPPSNLPVISLI